MNTDPPLVSPSDLALHAGRTVRLAGIYRAEFAPAHKMLSVDASGRGVAAGCVVLLELDDGSFVDLLDRPVAEGKRLNGARVVVMGELSAPMPEQARAGEDAASGGLYELIRIKGVEPDR
jgi:hypothetical protein